MLPNIHELKMQLVTGGVRFVDFSIFLFPNRMGSRSGLSVYAKSKLRFFDSSIFFLIGMGLIRQVRARRASTVLPRNYVGGRASTSGVVCCTRRGEWDDRRDSGDHPTTRVECNTRLHECESVFRTSDKWYYHSKPTTHGVIGGEAMLATHQHSRSTVKRV